MKKIFFGNDRQVKIKALEYAMNLLIALVLFGGGMVLMIADSFNVVLLGLMFFISVTSIIICLSARGLYTGNDDDTK